MHSDTPVPTPDACSTAQPEGSSSKRGRDTGAGKQPASLTPRVAASALWAVGGQVAALGAVLVASPFTIRLLGPSRYGLWSLVQSGLSYLGLADLGMSTASTKFGAERYAEDDAEGESAVIWTALAITVSITAAAAVGAAVAAPPIVTNVLHVRPDLRPDGVLALRLACIVAVIYAVTNSINTPQQIRLRWRSLTLTTSGPVVLQVATAPVLLAVTAGGVATMAALMLVASVVAAVLNFRAAVRLQPALRRPHFSSGNAPGMIKYGGALLLSGIAAIPLATAERFFLAHFHSPTAVAYYAVAAALASVLAVIPAAVSRPMFPALTGLIAEERLEEHQQLYHQSLRGVFVLVTPLALVLAFVCRPFLSLWAGPSYAANSAVPFYVLLAGLWFNALAYIPFNQLLASGKASTVAKIHLAELIPYLVAAAVLTFAFGAAGAAVAWTGRVVLDAVLFFIVVRRRHALPWLPTPRRAKASVAGIVGLAALLWGLSEITSALSVRSVLGVLVLASYGWALWHFVLTEGDRRGLATLLAGVFRVRGSRTSADSS